MAISAIVNQVALNGLDMSDWHSSANSTMSNAYSSQVKALKQMEKSRKDHQDCLEENAVIYNELQHSLAHKVASSQAVIDGLSSQADCLDRWVANVLRSHAELQAASRATEGPFRLCTWRMGQREKRPLREHIRDRVSVALEQEKTVITSVDKKLNEAMKVSLAVRAELQMKIDELRRDVELKAQGLKGDELCFVTVARHASQSSSGRPGTPRRPSSARVGRRPGPPLPHGPAPLRGSRPSTASGSRPSSQAESIGSRPMSARGLGARRPACNSGRRGTPLSGCSYPKRESERSASISEPVDHELAARKLCTMNAKLLKQCGKWYADARCSTDKALQERVHEIQEMRKRLELEEKATLKKLRHTKGCIAETRNQMESLEEPMALCSMHSSWKSSGDGRLKDQVEIRLEEQKLHLLQTNKELRENRQLEKGIFTDLANQMERLKEELKDKTVALSIDLCCLTQGNPKALKA
jgi:hypothetical protein